MKKLPLIILSLAIAYNVQSQEVPQDGTKVIKVGRKFEGEYYSPFVANSFSDNVKRYAEKSVSRKLKKYGFEDITITKIGEVKSPLGIINDLHKTAGGNEAAGLRQVFTTTSIEGINSGIKKYFKQEKSYETKFQVNFIDNNTGKEYKLRVTTSWSIRYIIKQEIQS